MAAKKVDTTVDSTVVPLAAEMVEGRDMKLALLLAVKKVVRKAGNLDYG